MNNLQQLRKKTLSSNEILGLLNGKANIITYPKLSNFKSLDTAMGPHKALIILYETKKNFGHWTLIFKLNNNTVEFFDSYAMMPDDELALIDKEFRMLNNEVIPHLSRLIYNSGYNVEYNDHQLQSKTKDVNTCGRHVVSRLLFRDMDIDEYANMISESGYSPDDYVTIATNILSNERI